MKKFEVRVVNIRNSTGFIYCGRGTALGNPFKMRNEADRDRVCDLYIDWFAAKIKNKDPKVLELLREIYQAGLRDGIVKIGCYCAPKRCHLDTVRKWLMWQHSRRAEKENKIGGVPKRTNGAGCSPAG